MSASIIARIAEIQGLALPDLRALWRDLYFSEPPAYSREHLIRRMCYRVQELAHGGLPDATRAALRAVAERDGAGGQVRPLVRRDANKGGPVAGTRFVREWHGQRHEVDVVIGGFEYGGKCYRSLSAVAKVITGQHWNGPLFFGINRRKRKG